VDFRRKIGVLAAGIVLAVSGFGAAAAPAGATSVVNNMYCDRDTAWCYQTNPPYNPNFGHKCHWDFTLHNLHSGMYYTGCDLPWGADIH
jgi:hypothetical protein